MKTSNFPQQSLATQIEQHNGALTAKELAALLHMNVLTIFRHAKARRIPSFRVGVALRFDPFAVAQWLRAQTV